MIIEGSGIYITTEGRKYIRGFVGTEEGAQKYVKELVDEWLVESENLTKIAGSVSQAANAAFTAGFKHKVM